jgi:hypothetical protein
MPSNRLASHDPRKTWKAVDGPERSVYTSCDDHSSSAPSEGSSAASTFESRFMLMADLGDPVLEAGPFDVILYLAIPKNAFQGDELPLLESLGELREISPCEDAMPFSAGFVVAFVVLPALLGCDVEDDVLFVVLSGFGFCVLP